MSPLFRYVIVPMVIVGIACHLFVATAKLFPSYLFGAVAILFGVTAIRTQARKKRDAQRGWRVGHVGRDIMYYEEFRDGTWNRIEIDGELLVGKAHHVIYFASMKFPEWANERRDEIMRRIKSEFHPPNYKYDE